MADDPVKARALGAEALRSNSLPSTLLERPPRLVGPLPGDDSLVDPKTEDGNVVLVPTLLSGAEATMPASLTRTGGFVDGVVLLVLVNDVVDVAAALVGAGGTMIGSFVRLEFLVVVVDVVDDEVVDGDVVVVVSGATVDVGATVVGAFKVVGACVVEGASVVVCALVVVVALVVVGASVVEGALVVVGASVVVGAFVDVVTTAPHEFVRVGTGSTASNTRRFTMSWSMTSERLPGPNNRSHCQYSVQE